MSDFIIRTGDVVVCINDGPPRTSNSRTRQVKDRLQKGAHYRVTRVIWLYGEKGLHLAGLDHRPTDGWRAERFRKVLGCGGANLAQLRDDLPLDAGAAKCRQTVNLHSHCHF